VDWLSLVLFLSLEVVFTKCLADKVAWQYFVTVAPNVDLTLIAAVCVCLDEADNDKWRAM